MAIKIFINYRRGDARAEAARVRDRLASLFGNENLFMDVENLMAGERFDVTLERELSKCDVLIAVIGPRWLALLQERLGGEEKDFVREEIAWALRREIPVIPVVIDRTDLPKAESLPGDLRDLVLHQAQNVTHEKFGSDVEGIAGAIRAYAAQKGLSLSPPPTSRSHKGLALAAGAGGLAVAALAMAYVSGFGTKHAEPSSETGGANHAASAPSPTEPLSPASGAARTAGPAAVAARKEEEQSLAMRREEEAEAARLELERLRPGRVFRDCPDFCPEMVVLGTGTFVMGSDGGDSDEAPPHEVRISKPFAAGKLEVTFEEWDACVADGSCRHKPEADWGRERQPVVRVSWDDITREYLPWLSRKAGAPYRLLTESEWEYAARAGTTARFESGASVSRREAQFGDRRSAETGQRAPNRWGLYDMAGNVAEWVQDCHNDSYSGVPKDGRPAQESPDCVRVLRGGSWMSVAADLRPANREWDSSTNRNTTTGFRVARGL